MQTRRISLRSRDLARPGATDREPEQAPAPIAVVPVQRLSTLEVGAGNDPAEVDADRLAADALSRLALGSAGVRGSGSAAGGGAHRHTLDCPHIARAALPGSTVGAAGGTLDEATSAAIDQARGAGSPLPASTLRRMEAAFDADFSDVRVHTGGRSAVLNRSVTARAFTTGTDIFFGAGAYAPGTPAGDYVLAHELGHVVQSSRVATPPERQHDEHPDLGRTLRRAGPAGAPPARAFPPISGDFVLHPGALEAKADIVDNPASATGLSAAEAGGSHLLELKGDPLDRIKAGSRFKIDMIETAGNNRIIHLSGIGGSGSEKMIASYTADGKKVTAADELARLDEELPGMQFEVVGISGTPRAASAQTFVQLRQV